MAKIRRTGVPLAEFAGVKPAYGIKTGLNAAFLIDTATKDRLVREDPASAEVIKPYLRGQDVKRWSPDWQDLWMIVLKSSGDHAWPWSNTGDAAEEVFQTDLPVVTLAYEAAWKKNCGSGGTKAATGGSFGRALTTTCSSNQRLCTKSSKRILGMDSVRTRCFLTIRPSSCQPMMEWLLASSQLATDVGVQLALPCPT